jgi:hypothetical protein
VHLSALLFVMSNAIELGMNPVELTFLVPDEIVLLRLNRESRKMTKQFAFAADWKTIRTIKPMVSKNCELDWND